MHLLCESAFLLFLLAFSNVHMVSSIPRRLTCCTLEQRPVVYSSTEKGNRFGLEGLAIEYLKLLEKDEDLNFKCKAMHILGKNESVGFTNFVTRLNNCTNNTAETDSDDPVCKCELATGGWSITDYRFGKVDYLPPFVPDGLSVVIRMDSLMSGTTGPFFLAAFSPLVWLYIFGLMVLFAFLKMLDHRFTENLSSSTSLPASESRISRFFHTLYKSNFSRLARQALKSVLEVMIGSPDESEDNSRPVSTRHWLLNFLIMLCGLFLVLIYEAAMTAGLVVGEKVSQFVSVEDFKECRITADEVCIPAGGSLEEFWMSNIATMPCQKENGGKANMSSVDKKPIDMLINKDCTYLFSDRMTAAYETKVVERCKTILTTGTTMTMAGQAFLLPRGSEHTESLAMATVNLIEQGKLKPVDFLNGCEKLEGVMSISITDVRVFLIMAYTSCLLLFIMMVLQGKDEQESVDEGSKGSEDMSASERCDVCYDDSVTSTDVTESERCEGYDCFSYWHCLISVADVRKNLDEGL